MKYSTGIAGFLRRKLGGEPDEHNDQEGSPVKAVIGLGNPGQKYRGTRHNVGFLIVDELSRRFEADPPRDRFKSSIRECRRGELRVVLAQPQTYLNLSGNAVQQILNWYKLEAADALIVYDDMDLGFGVMRLRESGSAGGHNGLRSIIQSTGTDQLPRLRIGIGRGRSASTAHVLSTFSEQEREVLNDLIQRACDGVEYWLDDGPVAAMNQINQKPATNGANEDRRELSSRSTGASQCKGASAT